MTHRATQLGLVLVIGAGCALVLAADARVRGLLVNTCLLAGAVTAIGLPAAVLLATLLMRTDLPGRRPLLAIALCLPFIPLYLQAAAWQAGLGMQGAYLAWLGLPPLVTGWPGTIWIHTVTSLPWAVLIVAAGLAASDRRLEEYALLSLSPAQVIWRVTLRQAAPAIGAAALFVAISVAGEMTITNLFQVRTFAEELYTQLSLGESGDMPRLTGSAAWWYTAALALAAMFVIGQLTTTAVRPRRGAIEFTLRNPGVAGTVVALLLFVLVGVPLASLVSKAGLLVETGADGQRVRSWSLIKLISMIAASPVRFRREFWWSAVLASASATATVIAAFWLAWASRRRRALRTTMVALAALAFALPGPVIGLALIAILNRPGWPALAWLYDQSIFAPWLALVIRELPLATLIALHAVAGVPARLVELATVEGATTFELLRHVVRPHVWRTLLAAWLAAFCLGLGDLSATILVLPPGVDTIALRLFERLHFGAEDQVAAVSLALVAMFALGAGGACLLLRRQDRV